MPSKIRPIRVEGNIAYVPLTQGYEAVIDAADVHLVAGRNWFVLLRPGRYAYAVSRDYAGNAQTTVYMHRLIMGIGKGMSADHRDRNGLNNRRGNLRPATVEENNRNTGIRRDNASGFKGVSWHKETQKWQANIRSAGRKVYLGLFPTPEEAHAAYCNASAELHGEFGRIS